MLRRTSSTATSSCSRPVRFVPVDLGVLTCKRESETSVHAPHGSAGTLIGGRLSMLAQDIDLYKVFRIHPTAMALLTVDLEFIDANDEFLAATGHGLEELVGQKAFAVFPKMPPDPGGHPKWTVLEQAQASGRHESLTLERFDIEDPASPGVFQQR